MNNEIFLRDKFTKQSAGIWTQDHLNTSWMLLPLSHLNPRKQATRVALPRSLS